MDGTNYKTFQFKENSGTRELLVQGFMVSESNFLVSTVIPNAAFKADPIWFNYDKPGLNFAITDVRQWGVDNGFDLFEDGEDSQAPYIVSIGVNTGKTIITLTFNQKIDKTGDATALKAAITFAANGTTFSALGGSDSVGTVDGSTATLIITFNSALTTATNKLKIAAGALVDPNDNENVAITTVAIDVASPVATFAPLNTSTEFAVDGVITITFNEKVFLGADGSEIEDEDLAALLVLKETNSGGADVDFTATINPAKTIITITPDEELDTDQLYYAALLVNSVRDVSGNKNALTTITFTTVDTVVPIITWDPLNSATGVVVGKTITLTFSEAIKMADGSVIDDADITSLVVLKTPNSGGTPVAFTGTINGGKTIISINPDSDLSASTIYYVALLDEVVEDAAGNLVPAESITFTTV